MATWTNKCGVLFLALTSVYAVGEMSGGAERRASGKAPGTDVRLLDETAGPLASATTQPAQGQSAGAQQVNVSDAGTVEIHVSEANLSDVLRMLSQQARKNIIASKEVRGTVTANLYNVTIKEALDAVLKSNGFVYREKGNFIYVYSPRELAEIEKAERQLVTEVFRLYYTPVANAANMIKPALSTEAQVSFTTAAAVGIESNPKEAGGNAHAAEDVLIVRDYAENIERVRKILKEIDKRPQQVLVEATIVAARLTEGNELGIDFTLIGGVDFSSITHSAGQITSADFPKDAAYAGDHLSSVGSGTAFSKPSTPGFKVGVITSSMSLFLHALEETTDISILANPKILTLNKQRGEVLVGREDGYKTTTVTESTTVQTVEFLKTGTRLIFRPFIGDDGYVRMEIHPEDSAGGVRNELPSKQTTEVTTNVLVKDGHTIVIGGLFRELSQTDRSQVPGLGNLPILGALFRNQADSTEREEVIILLTPHIVKDDRAYAEASEKELKELERLRVGVRRGMMPWGRERLAESFYDCAVKEMAKASPNRQRAIWYLDCATNLNPKFVEAIGLKQELTGREVTAVDNSTIRSFVREKVLGQRKAGSSAAAVAPPVCPEPVTAGPADQQTPSPQESTPPPAAQQSQTTPGQTPAVEDWSWAQELLDTEVTAAVESVTPQPQTPDANAPATPQPEPAATDQPAAVETIVTELPAEELSHPEAQDSEQ